MNDELRVLIAYDGSECAENSIEAIPQAGLPREARALLVEVKEKWLPPFLKQRPSEKSFGAQTAAAKAVRVSEEVEGNEGESSHLTEVYKKLKAYFPEWKIEALTLRGSPSNQIIRKAEEWNANLIVVGSQGTTGDKLLSLGSVSQKIANEAQCSVSIIRGHSWKKGAPTRILIGLDGTRSAQMAVEIVAKRMWMMGSEVRLVTAMDAPKGRQISEEEAKQIGIWINSFADKAKQTLKNSALAVSHVVEEGDPKQIIVRAADEWGADCIFIGSNDTGSFYENLLLGSVATAVVARAHCTVEVIRDSDSRV